MMRKLIPLDISSVPDLLRLAEEVATTGKPRLLRRAGEDVAILMPLTSGTLRRRLPRTKTAADYDAFRASAGSWHDLDLDAFLKDNVESRNLNVRPTVDL
ncbi:MAG: hypothetical protein NVS2B7_34200 [Herpetosiphon sp.]